MGTISGLKMNFINEVRLKNTNKYILGVHSGHDSSACLLVNNKVGMAIARERLTRKKHDSGDPIECIEYILKAMKIRKKQIDLVIRNNWHDSDELNEEYYDDFPKVIVTYEHHKLHAFASLTVARELPCIILVIDGRGCRPEDISDFGYYESTEKNLFEVESVYIYDGKNITPAEKRFSKHHKNKYEWGSHIDSLGYAYASVSKAIFGNSESAGKVMALASLGENDELIPSPLIYSDTELVVNKQWLKYIEQFDLPLNWRDQKAQNIAYSIQEALEKYLIIRLEQLHEKYSIASFCLAGGVALNCKCNGKLANLDFVKSLAVFNASGDDGLSWGAAIWGYMENVDKYKPILWKFGTGKYTKGKYISYKSCASLAANYLKNNKIVGIFTLGSEFGPRALGNRSIIASPINIDNKHYLNKIVKCREEFRPYGGAIFRKNLKMISNDRFASPYMLSAFRICQEWKEKIPAVIHFDGTSRLQIVEEENSLLGELLNQFELLTDCPVLLNTSFNGKNEPIVETIEEAVLTARKIGLDYLIYENEIISLRENER